MYSSFCVHINTSIDVSCVSVGVVGSLISSELLCEAALVIFSANLF